MSAAVSPVGKASKLKTIAFVAGLPEGVALQSVDNITVCGQLAIPARLMEIDTVPTAILERTNVLVVPAPIKPAIAAEPEPGVTEIWVAPNNPGLALNSNWIAPPERLAVHVMSTASAGLLTTPPE